MKIKFSKVTIAFTALGLAFALVQIGLSLFYGVSDDPITRNDISGVTLELLFTCPFAIGEMGMERSSAWGWAAFFILMTLANVILYFCIGLCCSFVARMAKRWLKPAPQQL